MKIMLKNKKTTLIITSIITLLPMLFGFVLWNRLPEMMPTHWNAQGVVDGYNSKLFAVVGMPAFLTAIHIVCSFMTLSDPKRKNVSGKVFGLVLWICPLMSVLVGVITYAHALGAELKVNIIMPLVLGIVFIIIGNYLPKCKQNYTVGIKIPWTLGDEENWNKTHRLAGILWVIGGIVICVTSFFGSLVIFFSVVMIIAVVPMIYSYFYYRKHR